MERLNNSNNLLKAGCGGVNGWRPEVGAVFLDNCNTSSIIYYINGAATLATIAGIVMVSTGTTGGIPLAIAAELIRLGTSYITKIDRGYGIAVFYNRSPVEFWGQ